MSLLDHEKQKIQLILGTTSSIMGSGIVRLFLASPNPNIDMNNRNSVLETFPQLRDGKWCYTNVQGGLTFIRDRLDDTFMFQIYDLETFELRFEYELYYDLDYLSLDPLTHAFEMEECIAGFTFSDPNVARQFYNKVKHLKPSNESTAGVNVARKVSLTESKKKINNNSSSGGGSGGLFGLFGGRKSATKKKMDIGHVVAVKHNQHVGVNKDGTFDLSQLNPEWKHFFKEAGIKKQDLKNPETARAIYQTIEQNGYNITGKGPSKITYQEAPSDGGPVVNGAGTTTNITIGKPLAGTINQPTPAEYSNDILKQYYTPEQMRQYDDYKKQLAEYEKALIEFEMKKVELNKEASLDKWEKDNKTFLKEHEKIQRKSTDAKKKIPPPLPPRKQPPELPARKKAPAIDTTLQSTLPRGPPVSPINDQSDSNGISSSTASVSKPAPITVLSTSDIFALLGPKSMSTTTATSTTAGSITTINTTTPRGPPKPPPARLEPPKLPQPPKLPVIKQGDDPVTVLQRQAIVGARSAVAEATGSAVTIELHPKQNGDSESTEESGPGSKFFLNALAASKNALKDANQRPLNEQPASQIENGERNLLSNLKNVMAERRKHISEAMGSRVSDDEWSD